MGHAVYDVRCALRSWVFAVGVVLMGCGAPVEGEEFQVSEQPLAGEGAAGVLPAGLPARLGVGLFSDTGDRWMRDSGVAWDYRYRYFTKGWVENWGWGQYDGSWGLEYMRECDQQGFVPAIQYYQMHGEPGGGEAQFHQKTRSVSTMRSYFGDFKILMQRAKDFGKPVVILLEADGYALLQRQTQDDPDAYAAVAATGMPELAGLPDTAAGWGLAFLQLRKAVGATNVILGIHVSAWASGKDIAHFDVTSPLQPEVSKVYGYLSKLGLGPNVTGETYDVLVGDPLDRDADFYRLTYGQDRWWDPSDGASVQSKSFNRYAEWMRLWNQTAQKRWILWQIPLGNSNHLNVPNEGRARQGYKDNRAEYFFANGTAHLEKFADAGAIALLFGAGLGGQSWYDNDYYTDGQLFMKSRAGAILNAGGVPLAAGAPGNGTGGSSGSGGSGGGSGGSGGGAGAGDTAQYGFESGTQGWASSGGMIRRLSSSTSRAFAGRRSLAVTVNGSGSQRVFVREPATPAGRTVTFRVYVPRGVNVTSLQPYVLQGAGGGWAWTGAWTPGASLQTGAWNTLSVTVPSNAATPLYELGVELTLGSTANTTFHVDAVTW